MVEERRKETNAKYRAKPDGDNQGWRRRNAEFDACCGVPTELLRPGLLAELIQVAKHAGVWRATATGMEVENDVET